MLDWHSGRGGRNHESTRKKYISQYELSSKTFRVLEELPACFVVYYSKHTWLKCYDVHAKDYSVLR